MPVTDLQIEDYKLGRLLGRGGMGTVFEGLHKRIGRRAAIKLLAPDLCVDQAVVQRFLNEAKAVNLINHPSIVQIYQFGQLADGTAYIIMEYLEGELLGARIRREGPLGKAAVHLARQMAQALVAAHEKQVIHRDLKPANVMIIRDTEARTGERVKVLDFGVAKLPTSEGLTQESQPLGTPSFMAPEQWEGGQVTDRADVYALGLLLYAMVAGSHPFQGARKEDLPALHRSARAPELSSMVPSVDPQISELVVSMLHKDPTKRPSMAEVAAILGGIETPKTPPAPRWTLRHYTIGASALVTAALLLLFSSRWTSRDPAKPTQLPAATDPPKDSLAPIAQPSSQRTAQAAEPQVPRRPKASRNPATLPKREPLKRKYQTDEDIPILP